MVYTVTGSGTINESALGNCSNTCTHDYTAASSVTINGMPSNNQNYLESWNGCTAQGAICQRTLDAGTIAITTNFSGKPQLTVATSGGNGAAMLTKSGQGPSCGPNCSYQVPGDVVMAEVSPPQYFDSWTGATCPAAQCNITMGSTNKTVTANLLNSVAWTLTNDSDTGNYGNISVSGAQTCSGQSGQTITCSYVNAEDVQVNLMATPISGSTFDGWTVSPSNAILNNSCGGMTTCQVKVVPGLSVTGSFNDI